MSALPEEEARAALVSQLGFPPGAPMYSCRINFFDSGYFALGKGALAIVRRDMLGRTHQSAIPLSEIVGVFVSTEKKRKRSLRFGWQETSWRIDQVSDRGWITLLDAVTGEGAGAQPAEQWEAPKGERSQIEPADFDIVDTAVVPEPSPTQDAWLDPEDLVEVADDGGGAPPPARIVVPAAPPPTLEQIYRELHAAGATQIGTPLRRLCKLGVDDGNVPLALAAAQALDAIREAGVLEDRVLKEHAPPPRLTQSQGELSASMWDVLVGFTPGDRRLAAVVEAIAPALIRMVSHPKRAFALGPRLPDADSLVFGQVFNYLRRFLAVPEVEYHPAEESGSGIQLASLRDGGTWQPTLVVGREFLSHHSDRQLALLIARELTYLRRGHIMSALVPNLSQQALAVLTCVSLVEPDHPMLGDRDAINRQADALSPHMTLDDFDAIRASVKTLLASEELFDLARWNLAVEMAGLRVGLLACGDMRLVARAINPGPDGDHERYRWLLAEIIRFSVGEAFLEIRGALGL